MCRIGQLKRFVGYLDDDLCSMGWIWSRVVEAVGVRRSVCFMPEAFNVPLLFVHLVRSNNISNGNPGFIGIRIVGLSMTCNQSIGHSISYSPSPPLPFPTFSPKHHPKQPFHNYDIQALLTQSRSSFIHSFHLII